MLPAPRRARHRLAAATTVTAALTTALVATTIAPATADPITPSGNTTRALTTTHLTTAADRRMNQALATRATTARFGTAFSGAVIDVTNGNLVWSKNGTTALRPASTTKLVTATNALRVFGPGYRFTTTVRRGAQADQVYIVGSGDPAFSSAQLTSLAQTTATALKNSGTTAIRLYADDSLFAAPSLATGWQSSYIPGDTTWLRALVVDGRLVNDTTIDAAGMFASKLASNGINVTRKGRGVAGSSAPVLASSAGQTVSQIVSRMLVESDNEHAEALHRLVAVKKGVGNTWSAARTAQSRQLAAEGLTATALYDGSGLSRSDRLSGLQLAQVVANAFEPANKTPLATLRSPSGLAIAGQTGTLRASWDRFTSSTSKCAAGKVYAKTGTLSDAVSLAGWTVGTDGRVKAFAFVINGKPTSTTVQRQNIDMLAATVNGCF
jgi:D-alanyl-D-alanine carboxypeptidase/D-alanyl-D-alanine-endopeptidase (penicillin-binding protein 4)